MFDRYSESARRAIVLSTEESRILGHNHVGTEHLLAAIAHLGGRGAAVLSHFGLTFEYIREAIIEQIGRGPGDNAGHLPLTELAKCALSLAARETVELRDAKVDDTHLLLGVLATESGIGQIIIRSKVSNISEIRETLLKDMAITRAESSAGTASPADLKLQTLLEGMASAGAAPDATEYQRGAADTAVKILATIRKAA